MGLWHNLKQIFWPDIAKHADDYEARFHIWAYGTKHRICYLEKMKFWNALHGDKLILYSAGLVMVDIEKMYDLFDAHLYEIETANHKIRCKNDA